MKEFIKLLIISSLIFIAFSCNKEEFTTDSSAKLAFSTDTLHFDTVFTTIGSSTHFMMVYNNNSKSIRVSSIRLAGGETSPFKINIDGNPVQSDNNLEIAPNDSIFIFIQVTVDPTDQNSPLLISDSILFETNGNLQKVQLEAWGQDVHLIRNLHAETQTWTNDKPYLVYDSLIVDSANTLTIEKGVTIYFHKHGRMQVDGTLICNGTLDEPITFRGDRLDKVISGIPYDKNPGQWDGIWMRSSSSNNKLTYTNIRNAVVGLYVGEINSYSTPNLEMLNCKVENHSSTGLFVTHANVKAVNSLFDNCGTVVFSSLGGTVDFYHCTFANYFVAGRQNASTTVYLTNYWKIKDYYDNTYEFYEDLHRAYFANCIIYGSNSYEFDIYGVSSNELNYKFEYNLIKFDIANNENDSINPADLNKFYKNTFSTDTGIFISTEAFKCNFELKKRSIALDRGDLDIAKLYPLDYYGNSRIADESPDLGAFEKTE
jgi:hypothetical protein